MSRAALQSCLQSLLARGFIGSLQMKKSCQLWHPYWKCVWKWGVYITCVGTVARQTVCCVLMSMCISLEREAVMCVYWHIWESFFFSAQFLPWMWWAHAKWLGSKGKYSHPPVTAEIPDRKNKLCRSHDRRRIPWHVWERLWAASCRRWAEG